MIPFVAQPEFHVGPLTIHAFGVAVAVAMWFGLTMARRQFERTGLDPIIGSRLGTWMIVGGVIGAHLFAVLLYVPDKLRSDPWLLLRVWEDISSFGGLLGGVIGAGLFFRLRVRDMDRRGMLLYLDQVVLVFPGALAIGRLGCAMAHDHPGAVTSFPLAISLETEAARTFYGRATDGAGIIPVQLGGASIGFHDLGLYEMLFLALVVVPAFMMWRHRQRPAGFYLAAFAALYFPVRFGLDMLRVADARYLGLTPAQWGAALVMVGLPFAVIRHRRRRIALSGAIILATACACWAGP